MQIDDPVADILCNRIYPENGFPQRGLEYHVVRDACVRRHKLLVYFSPVRGTDSFAHIGSDVATKDIWTYLLCSVFLFAIGGISTVFVLIITLRRSCPGFGRRESNIRYSWLWEECI